MFDNDDAWAWRLQRLALACLHAKNVSHAAISERASFEGGRNLHVHDLAWPRPSRKLGMRHGALVGVDGHASHLAGWAAVRMS